MNIDISRLGPGLFRKAILRHAGLGYPKKILFSKTGPTPPESLFEPKLGWTFASSGTIVG